MEIKNRQDAIAYLRNIAESATLANYQAALRMAIEALEGTQWISVKERLPEKKQHVLFAGQNGEVSFATDFLDWPDGMVSFRTPASGKWERGYYWMPLPKPPEEDA